MLATLRWEMVAVLLATATGCKSSGDASPSAGRLTPVGSRQVVHIAGSVLLAPLMTKWSSEYAKVNPSVEVDYAASGSGAGLRAFLANTVPVGTVDSPMTDDQLKQVHSPVVHIPLVMGAVVPIYNLPSMAHAVRFNAETLAGIFLGEIRMWNDPKLVAINPHIDLPNTPIAVVHRLRCPRTS